MVNCKCSVHLFLVLKKLTLPCKGNLFIGFAPDFFIIWGIIKRICQTR